ncbi:phage tail tape measure protein [Paenibacillus macerans]|uniref:phage tail tape measure protein n=1 Tax=Paenibacillus macerans TaxID=44252 RepID=UPI002DB766CA|nr:phage tail tape measure protein [Paenibacillus macerans]MEC0328676.1 phage tail tape measure protein [Paenibacillus macerans]
MAIDIVAKLRLLDGITRPLRGVMGSFAQFTAAATGASVAIGGVALAADSVKKAMDFESQLSTIQALTGASNEEMAQMQTLALKMGSATKYSALEAAQGIEELLKAGLTPATVQAGGLEAALNLATAGELGLADAAEIMSTALNAYKDDGMAAADASNILAGTANASATGVEDLRYSLAAVSAVAAGLGVNFKDTNTALGLFANNGLKGSDAGTSLKTMLQNLQPGTKAQIEQFKELGLVTKDGANQFFDAKGNIKSLEQIAGLLRKSLGKLTNQQRMVALETMFGTDAIRAANILYKEGADGVKNFQKEMSKVTALDVAQKKMDNAAGAVEQFNGALETLQISALLPTMPLIKDFANAAAEFVEKYTPQITAAMERMVDKAKNYLSSHFTNNPEFQKLTTLEAQIQFVFKDIQKTISDWWGGSGKQAFTQLATDVTKLMIEVIKSQTPMIAEVGLEVGKALIAGVVEGIMSDPLAGSLFTSSTAGATGGGLGNMAAQWVKKNIFGASGDDSAKGHSSGLDRVPYNGYPARLHKDETVLTRGEAAEYREQQRGGGGGSPIMVTGNTFIVRQESDIDAIAAALARKLANA